MKRVVFIIAIVGAVLGSMAAVRDTNAHQALFIDPSIRASGMGRASTAVFWGETPNDWANPALLSYHRGVRYEHSKTQLVPDLADEVYFTTDRLVLGAWGIGLSFAGEPLDALGGYDLDYGRSIATDEQGNEIGVFRSYEKVTSWGIAASLAEVTENLLRLASRKAPRISRFGDISLGLTSKTDDILLAPGIFTSSGEQARAEVSTKDRGALFRMTPYNSMNDRGWLPDLDAALHPVFGGLRLDVCYGRSTQNWDDAIVVWADEDQADPVAEVSRTGWAIDAALGFPGLVADPARESGLGLLVESLTPLISWGKAWDTSRSSFDDRDIESSGWELTFANIYSIRRGRYDDPDGDIHGPTEGWGLGFRIADIAGFRYDKATVPQAIGLDTVQRKGYTIFVDPVALWRRLKTKRAEV